MTARKPLWNQNGTTSAEEDRALITGLLANQGGRFGIGDLAVTQHGTPNMSVDVAAGRCAIPGTESASLQGTYIGWLDATQNVVIAASDATNARIDLIVARIKDQQYSGASDTFTVEAVTGTPSGSPAVPAVPANSIVLAQIAVAATVTTIVTANISDKRTATGARIPVVLLGSFFQPSPTAGQVIYSASADANEGVYFFSGSSYKRPWSMPWGQVAEAVVTAPVTATTVVDITGLTVTFTWFANRLLRTTIIARSESTVANDLVGIQITDAAGTALSEMDQNADVVNKGQPHEVTHSETSTSSATTRKGRLLRVSGTGTAKVNATATLKVFLRVDDVGPGGSPS